MPYSSLGRPATALSPMLGIIGAVEHPDVGAVRRVRTTLRRLVARSCAGMWPSNMSGGSTRWSSTLTRIMSSASIT